DGHVTGVQTCALPISTMAALEQERASREGVPPAVAQGWTAMRTGRPATYGALVELARDPGPLASALASTPHTLIHADWKLGNLEIGRASCRERGESSG